MARTTRPRKSSTAAQPLRLPPDVRLMNAVAMIVGVMALVYALLAARAWLMRAPYFPIRQIELQGELARNNLPTLRANATPLLAGNFFSMNLAQGRQAFEAVPWVRRAVLHRVWPDTLVVRLEEHRPAALWEGPADAADEGSSAPTDRLVNQQGEVFQANLGDVEDDDLPRLAGPEGTSRQMLAVLGQVSAALAPLQFAISRLTLSHRGSWRAELDTGAVVELGRGNDAEVVARSQRFARTFTDVKARWPQPLDYADLRHADGYALRLRGVTTSLNTNSNMNTTGPALARQN
jgi:cell division protein FtsQ